MEAQATNQVSHEGVECVGLRPSGTAEHRLFVSGNGDAVQQSNERHLTHTEVKANSARRSIVSEEVSTEKESKLDLWGNLSDVRKRAFAAQTFALIRKEKK